MNINQYRAKLLIEAAELLKDAETLEESSNRPMIWELPSYIKKTIKKYKKRSSKNVCKNSKVSSADKPNIQEYENKINEIYNDIIKFCNKWVSEKNRDKEYQNRIKKSIESSDTINYNGLHVYDGGDYIEIIDGDQEACIELNWIVNDLATAVEKEFGIAVGTGDGDEGCIYVY